MEGERKVYATMGKREENKEKMEQRIFDAAIDLFCEMGYQKTTLIDIASEAEVSTRTLYKYFPTKESILRKFCHENLLSLREYASNLPIELPLKEKIVMTMVADFKMMFGLFDVSYLVHSARDETGMYQRFEMKNIMSTEALYCMFYKQEQMQHGIEPNDNVGLCASVTMAIYRHCNDLYRFRYRGKLDEAFLQTFYRTYLESIWDALMATLLSPPSKGVQLVSRDRAIYKSGV